MESAASKTCTKCKTDQPLAFFFKQKKASDGLSTWCKTCVIIDIRNRARLRKKEAIEQLGGKCASCGGIFHQAAYDFHHKDPSEKEGGIAKLLQSYSINHPKIQKELNKCILLCSNCHRVLHSLD